MRRLALSAALCLTTLFPSIAAVPAEMRPPFRRLWRFDSTSVSDSQIDDLMVGKRAVFVSTWETYGALDLATGKPLWLTRLPEELFGVSFASDGQNLFVRVGLGELLACDPATGEVRWKLPGAGYPGPMLWDRGLLFGELRDGVLAAVDTRARRVRWRVALEKLPLPEDIGRDAGVATRLIAEGDSVYLGTGAGEVLRVDRATGRVRWRFRVDTRDTNHPSGLALDAGAVYAVQRNGEVIALDRATGRRRWRARAGGRIDGEPARIGGVLVVANEYGDVLGLDAATGKVRWRRRLSGASNLSISDVMEHAGRALVSVEDTVYALDSQGRTAWKYVVEEGLFGMPMAVLPDGLLLADSHEVFRFVKGSPPPLPSDVAARRNLARRLVARFDRLDDDERRTLGKLGNEALEALLPLMRQRLNAWYKASPADEKRYEAAEDAAEDALRAVWTVARPSHALALLDLLPLAPPGREDDSVRYQLFTLVARKAGEKALPAMLAELRRLPAKDVALGSALQVVTRSSHPDAVAFLIAALRDANANYVVRQAAYVHLSGIGGVEGRSAVRAVRDTSRTVAPEHRREPALDTDGDGFSDQAERGLGLDPRKPDTDVDGLSDGEDRNPLAAPRPLSDAEKVLAAAFEARMRFEENPPDLCWVELPKGVRPFELFGTVGPIVAVVSGKDPHSALSAGQAVVSFRRPNMGFTGPVRDRDTAPVILWNPSRNQARVQVIVWYGPLAATGYVVQVRRFGDEWLPVGMKMEWIS